MEDFDPFESVGVVDNPGEGDDVAGRVAGVARPEACCKIGEGDTEDILGRLYYRTGAPGDGQQSRAIHRCTQHRPAVMSFIR